MGRKDDSDVDQKLREVFRRHDDDLLFTRAMQDRVMETIDRQVDHQSGESRSSRGSAKGLAHRRRWWTAGSSAVAACMLLAVAGIVAWQHRPNADLGGGTFQLEAANRPSGLSSEASSTGTATPNVNGGMIRFEAPLHQMAADIPASLAPIESQNLMLTPGMSAFALRQQALDGGSPVNKSTGSTGSTGAPVRSGTHGLAGTANGSVTGPRTFVQLAKQEFTVSTRLYNSSDSPINGRRLQGMLFILKGQGGTSPDIQADWEYFVDGPTVVIPAHGSVPWTFTPNPAPPYKSLATRRAHLIWMFRNPDPHYPTLYLGTLPVQAANVQLQVTGETTEPPLTQFLRITARLTNRGTSAWDVRTALGMLFFERQPGVSLLSQGTYKYFDDIAPVAGNPTVLKPGASGEVQFVITGVPGTDMTRLPLTILLVARNQIGA